jgi:glucose/arabinose dehydrogenase
MALGLGGTVAVAGTASGFKATTVLKGMTQPTVVQFANDGRIFVAEKSGLIKIFDGFNDADGPDVIDVLPAQVYDLWDRGLLGLAVHPNFPRTPYIYALFTYDKKVAAQLPLGDGSSQWHDECPDIPGANTAGCVVNARLVRLEIAPSNTLVGAPKVMVEGGWCQQYPSHSIGTVTFGEDGALYVGAGDGAAWTFTDRGQVQNFCADPMGGNGSADDEGGALRSQDLLTPGDPVSYDGSILRIDPITGKALSSNPLVGGTATDDDRIIAFGLRNPFRFAWRPGTEELWIGDVGQNTWEEINVIGDANDSVVENFGWPCYEGGYSARTGGSSLRQPKFDADNLDLCEKQYSGKLPSALRAPHYAYSHSEQVVTGGNCGSGNSSISGIAFYQGGNYPASFDGALFFADSSRQCVFVMKTDAAGNPDPRQRSELIWGGDSGPVVDLKIGPGGDLYYIDIYGGTVKRLSYFSGNYPPVAAISPSTTSGALPLKVSLDGSASSDRDPGDVLQYAWDLDGDGKYDDATGVRTSVSFTKAGKHTVGLRVSDGKANATASVDIFAGDTPPAVTISSPASSYKWSVGDNIAVTGGARDAEDGALPASALTWEIGLYHCSTPTNCHLHLIERRSGVSRLTIDVPNHEYPAFLQIVLTATDSAGLESTTMMVLDPKTVPVTFQTVPSGLKLLFDDELHTTPFTETAIVGSTLSLAAPSPQDLGGTRYYFGEWSNSGGQNHDYIVPATAATLTATFQKTADARGVIPSTGWTLLGVDSEETTADDGRAANAFDGNPASLWHTEWYLQDPLPPHELRIDLGDRYNVDGFRYLPRQDGLDNGNIADYEFYVSSDGKNWGTPVAKGSFSAGSAEKEIKIAQPTLGRYVRLRALREVKGRAWTSVAEFKVLGSPVGSGNQAPNGTITQPAGDVTIQAGETVTFAGRGADPDNNTPLSYRWQFDDASIAEATVARPGAVRFNTPGVYTVSFTVSDAKGTADPTPATMQVTVRDAGSPPSGVIPSAGWSVLYVDSEETLGEDGRARNAFDGNPATMWHTQWYLTNPDPQPPHELQIDLGDQYRLEGLRYLPRQDNLTNGNIGDYEVYVSNDGVNWGSAVAAGTLPATRTETEIRFTRVKDGRYVRLRALREVSGRAWTSVAELKLLGTTVLTPPPPAQSGVIPRAGWKLLGVDSQETAGEDGRAQNAFDGNPATIWHTEWVAKDPTPPHEITIDLGASFRIDGFRYLPRQDGLSNGNIANYELLVSADGVKWPAPAAKGTLANTSKEQEVKFAQAVQGRYVRLRALTEVKGRPWTSMAELNLLGAR